MAARPYARQMGAVLRSLAARASSEAHPLLVERPENRIELVVMTGDKGLCGSFNTNILKAAQGFLMERRETTKAIHCIGKKGRDFFRRRKVPIGKEYVDVFSRPDPARATEIANDLIARFVDGQLDAVYLIYNEFKSVVQQRVVVDRVLPIERHEFGEGETREDYLYEPDAAQLFDALLPRHIAIQIWQAILESAAAEHGARMSAMEAASSNADEMIDSLTLYLNRVRQASITKEIIEVVSGAEAL